MSRSSRVDSFLKAERINAILSWILVAIVLLIAIESVLRGDALWAVFAITVAVLALLPSLAFRRRSVMLPWEVLALAALPLFGRALAQQSLTGEFATYLAVAALALIVAVELHLFTPVRMTSGFAVLFVVVTTLAAGGVWAVLRWGVDVLFGTGFLLEPGVPEAVIERALMWEFVYSTGAGVLAGVLFEWYFRRRARLEKRVAITADGRSS